MTDAGMAFTIVNAITAALVIAVRRHLSALADSLEH
jgi:hypothetical protein